MSNILTMNIIGISAFYHDAACCLLQDGKLVAAAEEERFTRVKADPSFPTNAFQYCLNEAGLTVADIDSLAYYENPQKKMARQLWSGAYKTVRNWPEYLGPLAVEREIREKTGYEGSIRNFDHHLSHAASSYYFSGFTEAAIFTVDGVGEWATTAYGAGSGKNLSLFEEVQFPNSIGLLYSALTSYLGFEVNDGEYKVMGLAPYGVPSHVSQLYELIAMGKDGQYCLNMRYFDFLETHCMYSQELISLLGQPPRHRDADLTQYHRDIARSIQVVLEEVLVAKANYLHQKTGLDNLCMAGGVALNCVANGRILRNSPFKEMYIPPAPNDAGGAIGAAALVHVECAGELPMNGKKLDVYLGPAYSPEHVSQFLESTTIVYRDYRNDKVKLLRQTVEALQKGKVVGWFQGKMEFGPRSLGARSILADPRRSEMRDRINAMIKKRESFRPFAPAVLDLKTRDHFDLDHPSPYMLETCQVISSLSLPAITHIDGSARVQTVHRETNERFYDLLLEFNESTGCPILLNTSFNVKGEPIVCSPEDAVMCFITAGIEWLVIEDFVIDRSENDFDVLKYVLDNIPPVMKGIRGDVYTFI
jgi:carbamoyltransferase